jgi:hypothetical protein
MCTIKITTKCQVLAIMAQTSRYASYNNAAHPVRRAMLIETYLLMVERLEEIDDSKHKERNRAAKCD